MRRHPARRFAAPLLVALAAAVFAAPASPPVLAQDARIAAVHSEFVIRAAEIAYDRDLDRARKRRALDGDRRQVANLRQAAILLMAYAPTFEPKTATWRWSVAVETRDDPVAYCLPGGKILLSTALLDRTRLTTDEVSVVLAHAIAHAMLGHDADLALRRFATMPEAADPNRRLLQLAEILGAVVQGATHDRDVERETDAVALEFMARAGVDPRAAPEAWRKIARAGGATPPGFLALHATWPGRIEEIEKQILPLLPIYEQAQAGFAGRARAPPVRPRSGLN